MIKVNNLQQLKKALAILIFSFLPTFVAAQLASFSSVFLWAPRLIGLGLLILFIGQEFFGKWKSLNLWKAIVLSYLAYIMLTSAQFLLILLGN